MKDEITKETTITLKVGLDENQVPVDMHWNASDGGGNGKCKAFMLSIWDEVDENTMRIDLWNKEMSVYDMQRFFHQTLLTMSDTFKNATGQENISNDIRKFADEFAKKTELLG
ncbi:gliding motility protein GldC [Cryomorpha ignava]|uniref:Gliding motility protein GldC n=1 Tax=Cryomorpha ignava TaxID=101383 RepID=A0A7K3WMU8_9FLAO|nr:gliding motility protein GldC [Cryomorpha ignava]NEN22966.1 gliding motility protein GldC [Cryomorpha ignava]